MSPIKVGAYLIASGFIAHKPEDEKTREIVDWVYEDRSGRLDETEDPDERRENVLELIQEK